MARAGATDAAPSSQAAIAAAASTPGDPLPALVASLRTSAPALVAGDALAIPSAHRPLADAALRTQLAAAVAAAAAAGEPAARHGNPPRVPALLSIASALASAGVLEPAGALAALEDVVDCLPVAQIDDAVSLIETAALPLLATVGWDRCKLALLRVCNGALARASRRAHARAAARVLLLLAAAAPPSDKSGLNLLGAANEGHPVIVPEVPDGAVDADGRPVDATLHATFWSLAPALQDPVAHLPPDAWPAFAGAVRAVLGAYAETPVAVAAGGPPDQATAEPETARDALPPVGHFHLASPALFGLQLRDGTARRHFLVGALIAVHAATHPPPKLAARRGVLRSKAAADAAALHSELLAALAATPARGRAFADAVAACLARETAWAAWKGEAPPCPPLDRAPAAPPTADEPPPKKRRGGLGAPPPPILGTPDLDRLWGLTADNASDLKTVDRGHAPSLIDFLRPVLTEMDPEEGIEEAYKSQHDPVFAWKALRQVARANLPAFGAALAAGRDLEVAAAALFPDAVPAGWAPRPPPAVAEKEGGGKRKEAESEGKDEGEAAAGAPAGAGDEATGAGAGDEPAGGDGDAEGEGEPAAVEPAADQPADAASPRPASSAAESGEAGE